MRAGGQQSGGATRQPSHDSGSCGSLTCALGGNSLGGNARAEPPISRTIRTRSRATHPCALGGNSLGGSARAEPPIRDLEDHSCIIEDPRLLPHCLGKNLKRDPNIDTAMWVDIVKNTIPAYVDSSHTVIQAHSHI